MMIRPWMVIGAVTFGLALIIGAMVNKRGVEWFRRLQRPNWLTFEWAIPIIWTVVFTLGAASATLTWEAADPGQRWGLMAFYLVLELVTLAYSPAMLWLRRIKVGLVLGATGVVLGLILAVTVFPISQTASLLLLPYLIWSPIGTYVTWEMIKLNPTEA
ncbi:TspO/MBR family protein [Leptolyngbya sp. AN02str]|uniref:TspO/MBR family protein n=1 Tax=Leptolyngbya sp. AN02str TaxID=3423363 RepID=UPI003D321D69